MTPLQHGRRSCYMNGCNRPECVAAHTRYCKEYEVRTSSRTRTLMVDSAPSRTILELYRDAGWSNSRIAAACSISAASVHDILAGQAVMWQSTADKIRALTPVPDPRPHVPSLGSVRRVRALVAGRHSVMAITAASELGNSTVRKLLHCPRSTIYVATADGAHRAYEALSGLTGTSSRSARTADANGWLPPSAWTHDDLDAPEFEEPVEPELTRAEMRAIAREMTAAGASAARIAERVGKDPRTIFRWRLDWQVAA